MYSPRSFRGHMEATYLDIVALLERRHRQFLEAVRFELDANGVHDINNVQAMILYNIGKMDIEMTVGELTLCGCYLGSNVSYNLKKLATHGYVVQERSPHDRRAVRIRLSEKGTALREKLDSMYLRHVTEPSRQGTPSEEELRRTSEMLRRLERFWSQSVEQGRRNMAVAPAD
jgi:DNA-binding MarR family transcriptional regulator